jgi:hypothetical protein
MRLVYVTVVAITNLEREDKFKENSAGGSGKKPWWFHLQCYTRIVVEGLKRTMEGFRREARSSSDFEAEVLMTGSSKVRLCG